MGDLRLPSDERTARIRTIFTTKRSYTLAEAASLLGIDEPDLIREVESGDVASLGDNRRLPWEEVAYLALRTWPLGVIFEALGSCETSLLPDLLRPKAITVTLPDYQVQMLEVLANEEKLDVATFLQLHLLDLASTESLLLANRIPGFMAALRFPYA
jgi:hypothetical protein